MLLLPSEKREEGFILKGGAEDGCRATVVTTYKKWIITTCIQYYTSISPKAELKVHVFVNVGHQQGCKVVTSGTSVKINIIFFLRVYDLYSFIASLPN